GHGAIGVADRAERRYGGVSAFGAHCAAGGHRAVADTMRHAGDVLRKPDEAAAEHPGSKTDGSAGASADVGANLLHDLHGAAEAAGGGAEGVLRRAGAGSGGGKVQARRKESAAA